MPKLHCCRTSLKKPLGSKPPWSKVPLNTGRNQALNTSPVKSTRCKQMAGEVPSPSCLLAKERRVNGAHDVLFCMGTKEIGQTLPSVMQCVWSSPNMLPPNTQCSYSPKLDKNLKTSLRTGSTASPEEAKWGDQESCTVGYETSLHCNWFVRHLPMLSS